MTLGPRWRRENIPVPEPHLAGLGVSLFLHRARPLRVRHGPVSRTAGTILLITGLAMGAWATWTAGMTDLDNPGRLVTRGPYAVSRNPMYLSWHMIYVGGALLVGSLWPLILLPGVSVTIHREVLREESHLQDRFGAEYTRYTRRVGRYL